MIGIIERKEEVIRRDFNTTTCFIGSKTNPNLDRLADLHIEEVGRPFSQVPDSDQNVELPLSGSRLKKPGAGPALVQSLFRARTNKRNSRLERRFVGIACILPDNVFW